MDKRKSKRANLETWKGPFFKIGISLSLVVTLLAFEYRIFERTSTVLEGGPVEWLDEDMIQITIPKPPEPPKLPDRQDVVVVPDEVLIDDTEFIVDIDAYADLSVPDFSLVDYTKPEDEVKEDEILVTAEIMPEFPGGFQALYKYLGSELNYPRLAKDLGIQGSVFIGFVVEKDGSVSNVHILRGIGGGCDEEAMRVVANMPRWKPGQMGTRPVRVSFSLPVRFKLEN